MKLYLQYFHICFIAYYNELTNVSHQQWVDIVTPFGDQKQKVSSNGP